MNPENLPCRLTYNAFAILVAVAIIALSALVVLKERAEGYRRAEVAVLNTATILAQQVETTFDHANALLITIGQRYLDVSSKRKDDVEQLNEQLKKELPNFPLVTRIGITDRDGIVVLNTGFDKDTSYRINLSDRDYFPHAKAGQTLQFAGPLKARLTDEWTLAMVRRLENRQGEFLGVIFAILPVQAFDKEFFNIDLGTSGSINLRTLDLAQVARYPALTGTDQGIGNKNVSRTIRDLMQSTPGREHYIYTTKAPIDGIERVYAYKKLAQAPYWMTVGIATRNFISTWYQTAFIMAAVSLSIIVLMFVGVRRLNRQNSALKRAFDNKVLAEQALRDSEARVKAMLNAVPDLVCRLDRKGKVIDYKQDSFLLNDQAAPAFYVHSIASNPAIQEHVPRVLGAGLLDTFEIEQPLLDEYGRTFEARMAPCGGDEVVAVIRDITERKRSDMELEEYRISLEEKVRQRTSDLLAAKQAAEAANRAKSSFLANMSHEIRTPLNAITGMVHVLRRTALGVEYRTHLNAIDRASSHLIDTIDAILDISKIEAGKLVLEETEIHPELLLENVTSILKQRAEQKGLFWRTETAILPRNLLGDPTRTQQALLNYASNAIKFTEAGGVTLRVKLLEESAGDALILFEVEDTGIGIEPEAIERLFSSFEQADNSTTRKYGGTGLGLTLTKDLAELMGGQAGVESRPEAGSRFWFTARLKKGLSESAIIDAPCPENVEIVLRRDFSGTRILLAEDEPTNREIAKMLLEDVGLMIDVAENGVDAAKLALDRRYPLVLMDMQMPQMDGVEATRLIRKHFDQEHMPIIAMTANAFSEDRIRCLSAGMNAFLSKPVNPDEMFAVLLIWLRKQRTASHQPLITGG